MKSEGEIGRVGKNTHLPQQGAHTGQLTLPHLFFPFFFFLFGFFLLFFSFGKAFLDLTYDTGGSRMWSA